MATLEVAEATKCTGDVTLAPLDGEVTVTPAHAAPVVRTVRNEIARSVRKEVLH